MKKEKKLFFEPLNWSYEEKKISHLTMTEKGAYFMLKKAYWGNDGCLPSDKARLKPGLQGGYQPGLMPGLSEALYRACGAHTKEERAAVDTVLEEFFPVVDGKHSHPDMDELLYNIKNNHLVLSESGKKGAEVRAGRRPKAVRGAVSHPTSQATIQAAAYNNHNKNINPLPLTVDKSGMKPLANAIKGLGIGEPYDIRKHLTPWSTTQGQKIAKAKGLDWERTLDRYNYGIETGKRTPPERPPGAFIQWLESVPAA